MLVPHEAAAAAAAFAAAHMVRLGSLHRGAQPARRGCKARNKTKVRSTGCGKLFPVAGRADAISGALLPRGASSLNSLSYTGTYSNVNITCPAAAGPTLQSSTRQTKRQETLALSALSSP